MSTNKRRSSLSLGEKMMFLAGSMFCLVLITTAMMGSLFGRYVSNGDSDDTARVAKWNVAAALLPMPGEGKDTSQVDVVCSNDQSEDGEFTITVTNNSEVAVTYNIVLGFSEELPAGVSVKLDGKTAEMKADHTVTFAGAGNLPANAAAPGEHTLSFTMTWADSDLVGDITQQERATLAVDFTVDVNVEQVD